MANKKFSELTEVTTPNSESIFATAYDGDNFKVTLTNIAANMPSITTTGTVTATTLTTETLTTTGNTSIGGNLAVTGTSTLSDDVTFTGDSYNAFWDKSDNRLEFFDNTKIVFGNSADLQIYHNGSASFIEDTGTGDLIIKSGDDLRLEDTNGDKYINCNENTGVEIYYNGSKKFETTSAGATVSGTLTATAFTGNLTGNVTGNADTATALATGRTIGMTGDVTWTSASFDGTGNVTGTASIGSGVIVNADVNASAAIDASKIHDGTVSNTEFGYLNGVSSAIQTQMDTKITASSSDTLTNKTFDANGTGNSLSNVEVADLASGVLDTDISSVSGSDDTLASAKAIKTYVDSQVTAQDLDFQADTGGALSIDLDTETLTFTGGTGIDTSGSGNAVTFAIDSTVATLSGTQTLTNKSGNISQWTNDSSYLTGNQTITLSGDASGSGTTAITVTVADDSHNHIISNVDGLQTALDGKVAETASTGSAEIPAGTTGERDGSPSAGFLRFNTTDTSFEGYDGSAWGAIGGGGGASAGGAIYENADDITSDYTITSGKNGFSVGPMTIASGVTVTVPSGQRWVIL